MDLWTIIKDWWASIETFFSNNGADLITRILLATIVTVGGHFLLKFLFVILRKSMNINKNRVEKSAQSFLLDVISVVCKVALVVLVLTILGVSFTGIATIISSGILAVGIALQDFIGNFASGILIILNKPFKAGDFVTIDGAEGTITEVKMMSTSLDTPNGQVITIPNRIIMSNYVTNYETNGRRRGVITLTLEFSQSVDQVTEIIDNILKEEKRLLKKMKYNIVITSYNEIGYVLSVRYHTKTSDYWDVTFSFNEKILKGLQENGITPAVKKI